MVPQFPDHPVKLRSTAGALGLVPQNQVQGLRQGRRNWRRALGSALSALTSRLFWEPSSQNPTLLPVHGPVAAASEDSLKENASLKAKVASGRAPPPQECAWLAWGPGPSSAPAPNGGLGHLICSVGAHALGEVISLFGNHSCLRAPHLQEASGAEERMMVWFTECLEERHLLRQTRADFCSVF